MKNRTNGIRKRFTVLLTILMVLAMLPLMSPRALANDTVDSWDGTADTSWYDAANPQTSYNITTAEQLAGLAQLVNNRSGSVSFEGVTITLQKDLDLSGHDWTSIGNGASNMRQFFAGTFDGNDHTIYGLTSEKTHSPSSTTDPRHGLFGVVGGYILRPRPSRSVKGTIENLKISGAKVLSDGTSNAETAGILCDWAYYADIRNCCTSGSIESKTGSTLLGGLIGQCTCGTTVSGCYSTASVISTLDTTLNPEKSCDTIGGLVGQWESSEEGSCISDCWFGGSIHTDYGDSAVGGILGANFDFDDSRPGTEIRNCMVATKNITSAEPGNVTWIAAESYDRARLCWWPDSPPEGVTLDSANYPDNKGTYFAYVKLILDSSGTSASPDPAFSDSVCGKAVSSFLDPQVLAGLQTNQGHGIEWVQGCQHPTFSWDAPYGHDLTEVPAKESTCREAGNIAHWKCRTCGRLFTDSKAKTGTTAEAVALPLKEHAFGAWEVTKKPTAASKGEKQRTCSKCGYVEKAEIPAAEKPGNGGSQLKPGSKNPGTGDSSQAALWAVLMLAAGGSTLGVIRKRKAADR